ncbi:hypothetical protein C5C24_05770 [Rathayibacter sp. AY2B3]|uniref:hypothetical protein n=1 Tax=Rathayibacter sp. AY2B3 TaxID=2080569 RepID=UPI000CE7E90B|nr:hypothetical protein [Rathayibacter sp. AY2B3]PPG51986.1 hypothetical protein C5C24_05770 [Rathayibacter sp. AY2B3]
MVDDQTGPVPAYPAPRPGQLAPERGRRALPTGDTDRPAESTVPAPEAHAPAPEVPAAEGGTTSALAGPQRRRAAPSLPWLLPVLTAAGGLVIGVLLGLWVLPAIGSAVGSVGPTAIESALETCDVSPGGYFALGDDGTSLSMQTEGAESPGADLADVACVLSEVDVPDSVLTRIDSTRALDGRQEASWDDLDASWGYHPDNGLDLVLERHRD